MSEPPIDRRRFTSVTIAIASLCVVILLQVGGFVWWAATISSDVRHLTLGFIAMQAGQYTKEEARRDLTNASDRTTELARRVSVIEERMK